MTSGETPSLREQLQEVTETVKRIENALIGDEAFGNKGLVQRVEAVEEIAEKHDRKLEKHGRKLWLIGAGVTAIAAGIEIAIQFFHP